MRRILRTLLVCCLLNASSFGAHAEITSSEESLLAAFIFNITKFTHWKTPAMADGKSNPLRIAVVNNKEVFQALSDFTASKTLGPRKIEVRQANGDKVGDAEVVVVVPSSGEPLPTIQKLKGCKCLVVTKKDGLSQQGSIINFVTKEDKLRFEVNLQAARAEQVEFDSQLLRIGEVTQQ